MVRTRFYHSLFTIHRSRLFIFRRVVDDLDGAAADAAGVEGDGAVAVLLERAPLPARGRLERLARLDADADVLRVLRARRQERHAEAARVAQHGPVLVERLDAEAEPLVRAHVPLHVLGLDRDVVHDALDPQLLPLPHGLIVTPRRARVKACGATSLTGERRVRQPRPGQSDNERGRYGDGDRPAHRFA